MGTIPDDMGGIFAHLREAALTMQQGGGIGYDFSTLRPKGAPVKGVGADASGPAVVHGSVGRDVPHHHAAGSRRGAMMATLACDHPDIEDFIDAKRSRDAFACSISPCWSPTRSWRRCRNDAPWDLKFGGTHLQDAAGARIVGPRSCARHTNMPSLA